MFFSLIKLRPFLAGNNEGLSISGQMCSDLKFDQCHQENVCQMPLELRNSVVSLDRETSKTGNTSDICML